MTFKEIVDAVLADGFKEAQRTDAKRWVNFRHAWLWDVHRWTFKNDTATVTFNGTATPTGVPTDLQTVIALHDENGAQLQPYNDLHDFYSRYNSGLADTGAAEAFTVVGSTIILGPSTPSNSGSGLLVYEKTKPALVADSDTTGLPEGYDVALIHGGKAEGFKLINVPLWQGFDEDFTAAVNALATTYLVQTRAGGGQFGAYTPGSW